MRHRNFYYSREGHRKKDKRAINVKLHHDDTGTDGDARMIIKFHELYTIVKFEASHNHHCTPNKLT